MLSVEPARRRDDIVAGRLRTAKPVCQHGWHGCQRKQRSSNALRPADAQGTGGARVVPPRRCPSAPASTSPPCPAWRTGTGRQRRTWPQRVMPCSRRGGAGSCSTTRKASRGCRRLPQLGEYEDKATTLRAWSPGIVHGLLPDGGLRAGADTDRARHHGRDPPRPAGQSHGAPEARADAGRSAGIVVHRRPGGGRRPSRESVGVHHRGQCRVRRAHGRRPRVHRRSNRVVTRCQVPELGRASSFPCSPTGWAAG